MRIRSLYDKSDVKVALALGFFDCIHRGHLELVKKAMDCAEASNNKVHSALLTFCNDINDCFFGEKQIYTFEERARALADIGLQELVYAKFDREFMQLSANEFFDLLIDNASVDCLIVGEDYTFGKNAEGNTALLKKLCEERGIELIIMPFVVENNIKIASSTLKSYVKCGDIEALNKYLSEPYFMLGKVLHAKHNGTRIGFPTANIALDGNKLPLAQGIYATKITVDGLKYDAMTNVGTKPTFDDSSYTIETYIFDFDGDIYGKDIKLQFYKKTRDIVKFETPQDLKLQLEHDEKEIRALLKRFR